MLDFGQKPKVCWIYVKTQKCKKTKKVCLNLVENNKGCLILAKNKYA